MKQITFLISIQLLVDKTSLFKILLNFIVSTMKEQGYRYFIAFLRNINEGGGIKRQREEYLKYI